MFKDDNTSRFSTSPAADAAVVAAMLRAFVDVGDVVNGVVDSSEERMAVFCPEHVVYGSCTLFSVIDGKFSLLLDKFPSDGMMLLCAKFLVGFTVLV